MNDLILDLILGRLDFGSQLNFNYFAAISLLFTDKHWQVFTQPVHCWRWSCLSTFLNLLLLSLFTIRWWCDLSEWYLVSWPKILRNRWGFRLFVSWRQSLTRQMHTCTAGNSGTWSGIFLEDTWLIHQTVWSRLWTVVVDGQSEKLRCNCNCSRKTMTRDLGWKSRIISENQGGDCSEDKHWSKIWQSADPHTVRGYITRWHWIKSKSSSLEFGFRIREIQKKSWIPICLLSF